MSCSNAAPAGAHKTSMILQPAARHARRRGAV